MLALVFSAWAVCLGAVGAGFRRSFPCPDSAACRQVLFEEYARLMRYNPSIADFPSTISYEDELRLHTRGAHGLAREPTVR